MTQWAVLIDGRIAIYCADENEAWKLGYDIPTADIAEVVFR